MKQAIQTSNVRAFSHVLQETNGRALPGVLLGAQPARLKAPKDPTGAKRQAEWRARRRAVTPVTPVTAAGVTVPVTPPIDLAALKREIREWRDAHSEVGRVKRMLRRDYIQWQFSRFVFLAVGVGFYVLIGCAAMMGVQP